jgi:hypothetical protein
MRKRDCFVAASYSINIASGGGSEAIHFRDVKIGVKKIERMSVKNLAGDGVGERFSEDAMIFSTIFPRPVIFATFHQGKVETFST